MHFFREFCEILRWRPRQALGALYWHLTGRTVRARHRLVQGWHMAPDAYPRWIRCVERNPAAEARLAAAASNWKQRPLLSVLLSADAQSPNDLAGQITSIVEQPYAEWELLVCGPTRPDELPDDARVRFVVCPSAQPSIEAALAVAGGAWLVPIEPGAVIPRTALLRWAEAIRTSPEATLFYGDEDVIGEDGLRCRPWWKPEWQREMLLSQDFLSGACVLAVAPARALLPLDQVERAAPLYALLVELTVAAQIRVGHVAHVQCHRRPWSAEAGQAARLAVLEKHLSDSGAAVSSGRFGSHMVRWPLPATLPLVSIVIPTKDKADLLRACVESVLELTTWPAFEILLVDNNSEEPETFALLADLAREPRVRVLVDRSPYNFSAINNRAAAEARGSYLCLLNNDTEVIAPEWLDELMRHAVRPEVGAVGAKLLYPDSSIQHAGVVIGLGNAAGHAHRTLPDDEPGYFAQAHIAREATAVTAACLVVEKHKFDMVGGFDAADLAIAYNDVDLCLKLRAAGWVNIYAPAAVLFHHESVSRGDDFAPEHNARYRAELKVLQERWATDRRVDPLHHPRLDRATDQYVMTFSLEETE